MAKQKDKGLVDPVTELEEVLGESVDEDLDALDAAKYDEEADDLLRMDEIGAIQDRRTSAPHPFDDYRLARRVPLVTPKGAKTKEVTKISATHLVLLKRASEPQPDLSNENRTIYVSAKEGGGGKPSKGTAKIVTLPTSHTRVVTDRAGTTNIQVVFDREVVVGGTTFKCAVVTSHAARAQIMFQYDPNKNRVFSDKRYLLADQNQAVPLRKMFDAIHYQRTGAERRASEFEAAQESTVADRR